MQVNAGPQKYLFERNLRLQKLLLSVTISKMNNGKMSSLQENRKGRLIRVCWMPKEGHLAASEMWRFH